EYYGLRLLLDAIRDYLPAPTDRPPVKGLVPKTKDETERKPEPTEPFSALAFKTVSEKHGDLVFLRIYSGALKPGDVIRNPVDETNLAEALGKMVRDDPTLRARTDAETNQLIISGMGELHLEVAVHKLQRDHGVQVTVGRPMVAYRQTLAKAIEFETRYIKQS